MKVAVSGGQRAHGGIGLGTQDGVFVLLRDVCCETEAGAKMIGDELFGIQRWLRIHICTDSVRRCAIAPGHTWSIFDPLCREKLRMPTSYIAHERPGRPACAPEWQ